MALKKEKRGNLERKIQNPIVSLLIKKNSTYRDFEISVRFRSRERCV